jgi:hypothetical protein
MDNIFMDNIFVERLWRSVKYEEVYLKDYATPREARQGVGDDLNFYDYRRIDQALDYRTPAAVYFGSGSFLKGMNGQLEPHPTVRMACGKSCSSHG